MSTQSLARTGALLLLAVSLLLVPSAAQGQTCGPLLDGRVADVFYNGTVIHWDPVVEHDRLILTVRGPCEEVVKVFEAGEKVAFSLDEISRLVDGQYTWSARIVPAIDPGVQQDLHAARGTGEEDDLWWSYWQKGLIPDGPVVDSESFRVVRGEIIDPNSGGEEKSLADLRGNNGGGPPDADVPMSHASTPAPQEAERLSGGVFAPAPEQPEADFFIADDLIVDGSACIGFDCVNGETFNFDTIRLKENNLRIKFEDTSTASSFPTRDWQLTANESANGGLSKFSIQDVSGGRTPFTIEAAPSHSLYVDDGGRVGFGTSTPSVNLHAVDGDTPALRLEQDGSSGFAPQTWDIAGNETNFFVRDVTNGSTLPFRIRPGAPSSSIFIDVGGDVGFGTSSPGAKLHVEDGEVLVKNTTKPGFTLEDDSGTGASVWDFQLNANGLFQITKDGSGGPEVLVRERQDPGGLETLDVDGSIEADAFNVSSSRTFKTALEQVDTQEVLARVLALPVSEWTFKWDDEGTRHIGPMAEDFQGLFEVGNDATNISMGDAMGVALAAIQGLHQELQAKERELEEMKADFARRLLELEKAVTRAQQD